MTPSIRGILWLAAYTALCVLPLAVAALWPGEAAGRPYLLQFGVACGYTALTVMALEFALISKIHAVSSAFGQDALLQFHRHMGLVATVLLAVHIGLMLASGYPGAWLNPFTTESAWSIRWGVLAAWVLLVLVAVSLGRKQIGLAYEWWIWTHGTLAAATTIMALAHVVLVGGFSASEPMRVVLAGYFVMFAGLRVWFNLMRPLRLWSRPWEIAENRPELGAMRTLVLKPVGHAGFVFEPGQFAWLSTGQTPFHKDGHPISMSSPAADEPGGLVAFSIKDLGDWSGRVVPELKPGRRVWVDGPFGVFSCDREQGPGYVMIGGGAGITPLYSMCQTMAERGDVRPVVLFFGGRSWESLTFREELLALQARMNLKTVFVLENPPAGWAGESGYVTAELLRRHLPGQYQRFQYFVCGPEPLMDAMEEALPELGVPARQIHSERFVMV